MRFRFLLASVLCAAAVPVLAAPSCGTYTVVGSQCGTTVNLGWGTAGFGNDSIIGAAVSLTVSAPVTYSFTQLNSSLGTSYAGYFGIMVSVDGATPQVYTLANSNPITLSPGQGVILQVTKVCFDPTCTVAPPAGAVSNMFSLQIEILGASATDLAKLYTPLLTVRFLNSSGIVIDEEQELGVVGAPTKTTLGVPSVNEAATPATRYVQIGSQWTLPFDAFSVTNPSSTQSITGTVTLYDYSNNLVATANIPTIPPLGAVGDLLIGIPSNSTAALFPSSTMLPNPDSSGVFHGALVATFSGPAIFLAQEYNGDAMLNLVIY